MLGKAPKNILLAANLTQVQPMRVTRPDSPKPTLMVEFFDSLDGLTVSENMPNHQDPVVLGRQGL